jgi:hypothetical protein
MVKNQVPDEIIIRDLEQGGAKDWAVLEVEWPFDVSVDPVKCPGMRVFSSAQIDELRRTILG